MIEYDAKMVEISFHPTTYNYQHGTLSVGHEHGLIIHESDGVDGEQIHGGVVGSGNPLLAIEDPDI